MKRTRIFGAALLAALSLCSLPAPTEARPARPAPMADLPPCGSVLDLLSEQELEGLRLLGLRDRDVAAVALIAHHAEQPVLTVGRKRRAGASVASLARAAGLEPKALVRAAYQAARDLPPAAFPPRAVAAAR